MQRNEANGDGVRWFQLYWPKNEDEEITISMLNRAKKAGYTALVVTLDTYILGWRPSDMDNGYVSVSSHGNKEIFLIHRRATTLSSAPTTSAPLSASPTPFSAPASSKSTASKSSKT